MPDIEKGIKTLDETEILVNDLLRLIGRQRKALLGYARDMGFLLGPDLVHEKAGE
jgi:hypothetical protein